MARIRNGNKALSVGKVIFMEELETQNILAYKRILDGEEIIVIANIKGEPEKFDINKAGTMRDLVSGNKINCSEKISLNGYQIMILK
jgi:hypothetical protein